jgi:hypothetical protein
VNMKIRDRIAFAKIAHYTGCARHVTPTDQGCRVRSSATPLGSMTQGRRMG